MLANPPFCSLALFLIVLLTLFISKPDSSRVCNYFYDIIYFVIPVIPDPKIFFWIAESVAAAAVNPNGIKTLLANDLSTFFIKGKPVFGNGHRGPNRNPPRCTILEGWVFDNFSLNDELFAKALQSLETCVSVNKNLCGKLVSWLESPITFDERFKVTSVPFFILDFDLLSWELDKFYI